MKLVLFILALIYCAVPVDLFPGPIDDAIVCGVAAVIMRIFCIDNTTNKSNQNQIEDKHSD